MAQKTNRMIGIESLTAAYVDRRRALADRVRKLNDEIEAAKHRHLPIIRNFAATLAEDESRLRAEIASSPNLFENPRTVVVAGVKIGFQKGKGALVWEDDDTVVKLIRKNFPDEADALIKKVETPIKAALNNLAAADLKKIGVAVEGAGDQVVIKPADGEIEKLVAMYLKDAESK